jgi:hypothetical protein
MRLHQPGGGRGCGDEVADGGVGSKHGEVERHVFERLAGDEQAGEISRRG